jgi:phosphoribosylaminoimidazolecarboxamide formyltransferase/IMP cyclohydrolase
MTSSKVSRALISVSDKTGLVEFASQLLRQGVEIVSTGSTAQAIRDSGGVVTDVSQVTGFAEALDGRVKTLHPSIHGGILADRRRHSHTDQLESLGIAPFDLVVVNLYPFRETVASGASDDEVIENIDIGGPALIRAAAKNHASVAVVVDPADYPDVVSRMSSQTLDLERRRSLATKAYGHTAAYDQAIASWFEGHRDGEMELRAGGETPLRYGENSHQSASLYRFPTSQGLAHAAVIQGKDMSYNNYLDADAALRAAYDHEQPAVAIIKHQNPCGIAIGATLTEAYTRAHACDPVSAFGGVIAMNRPLDKDTAEAILPVFTEVVVAPEVTAEAREVFSAKPNIRLLEVHPDPVTKDYRVISGGILVQDRDTSFAPAESWDQVAGPDVSVDVLQDLGFAWRAVKSVKSNAILLAQSGASVGIGMGQVNRVDSCHLAVSRAGARASGSVAASDAFFPFPDGLQILIDAGVRAVVHPGGSVRDDEVTAAAVEGGIALFVTGERHFLH